MMHITDGESVAGTLREPAVPGEVSTYGDLMYEGPAPAGLDAAAWIDTRARFMADSGYATLDEARQYLQGCENILNAFSQHEEVVIWLDDRLSDQLILIKVLDWFSHRDLGPAKLSLICVDRLPGMDRFVGLGALTANELLTLANTRLPVSEAQYRTAQAGWKAFTSPDPTEIERFVATDTSALSFIATALRRHLEQFPSADSGLSRTERQALSVLREQGPVSQPRLFVAVQRMEERVYMGDVSFYRVIADLANARHPLVRISDNDATITEQGLKVLEGRADRIKLNGIDRWLGGVHLEGQGEGYRWDRASERIIRHG